MSRKDAPQIVYLVFNSNGEIVTATADEDEAYEENSGMVVTYTKA